MWHVCVLCVHTEWLDANCNHTSVKHVQILRFKSVDLWPECDVWKKVKILFSMYLHFDITDHSNQVFISTDQLDRLLYLALHLIALFNTYALDSTAQESTGISKYQISIQFHRARKRTLLLKQDNVIKMLTFNRAIYTRKQTRQKKIDSSWCHKTTKTEIR